MQRGGASRQFDEAGFSLIEMLLAIAILSIAVVTLITGLGVGIASADRHRKEADAAALVTAVAEKLKSSDPADPNYTPHRTCATAGDYQVALAPYLTGPDSPVVGLGPAWSAASVSVMKVEYFNGTTAFDNTCRECPPPTPGSGCIPYADDATPIPSFLQLVTLKVSSADGRASDTLAVVKDCRSHYATGETPTNVCAK